MVGPLFGRAQPQVPIHRGGDRRMLGRARHGLVAVGKPDMSFADFADRATPGEFHRASQSVRRRALIAQLRDDLVLAGEFAQYARFMHGACQRFFAINMFAASQRSGGGDGVGMIRRGHDDRINAAAHRVEHPAKVLKRFRLGIQLEFVRRPGLIHIAKRDNVFAQSGDGGMVVVPSPAATDHRDVELAVGVVGESTPAARQNEQTRAADGRGAQKVSARKGGPRTG